MITDPPSLPQVDLNQADVNTLMTLPDIGPKLAQRIIDFREEVHPFEEAIEITAVPGISERIYLQIADRLTVALPGPAQAVEEDTPVDEIDGATSPAEMADTVREGELQEVVPAGKAEAAMAQIPQPEKVGPKKKKQEEYYIVQFDEEEESVQEEDLAEGYVLSPDPEGKKDKSSFRRSWLLMLVGALLGTFLTLFILFFLNGRTLLIAENPKIVALEDELSAVRRQEATLRDDVEQLQEQVEQFEVLGARLQNTEAEIQILKQARDKLAGGLEDIQEEVSAMATRVITLEEQAGTLSDQVAILEEDSEQVKEIIDELQTETGRFDDFLSKLRDLLLAIQGVPETLPVSPSPNPTDVTSTPQPAPDPPPTPTPAS